MFASTGAFDRHHSVISRMGDRYLLCRIAPVEGQFERALAHAGEATEQMRKELAKAVAKLFDAQAREARPINIDELGRLSQIVSLVVRLRAAIDRDRDGREIEAVYGAEGTARLGLSLERLLAGLDTLGVERKMALKVVETVAMDSTPPIRRKAYEYLKRIPSSMTVKTSQVATEIGLPTNTVRRQLEDLAANGLAKRFPAEERGEADEWLALV